MIGEVLKSRKHYKINEFTYLNVSHFYNLPIHSMVLVSEDKRSVFVGALAFKEKGRRGTSVSVVAESLCDERVPVIQKYIYEGLGRKMLGGIREATFITEVQDFVRFGFWADANGHQDYLICPSAYRKALIAYTEMLNDRLRNKEISQNSASSSQRVPFDNSHLLFPENTLDIVGGIQRIPVATKMQLSANKDNTKRLGDIDIVFPYHTAIFRGLAKFVCGGYIFPFKLQLPKEDCWVIPSRRGFALTKQQVEKTDSRFRIWDIQTGELKKISDFPTANQKYVSEKINEMAEALLAANADHRHDIRQFLAKFAHDSFLVMFEAVTGINESDARKMRWSGDYTITRKAIGLKSVKHRANKQVEYFITDIFESDLKLFFSLRQYLVGEHDYPYFFVGQYARDQLGSPLEKLHASVILRHGQRVKNNMDNTIPILSYQLLREYRSKELLKENDPEIAAALSNHTVDTLANNYIKPSVAEAEYELTTYYKKVVVRVDEVRLSLTDTPAGACEDYGHPVKLLDVASVEPDCKNFQGCLFCDHFVVHARREDIVKLNSLLFVVSSSTDVCDTPEIYHAIYDPIINKVNSLLKGISELSPEMASLCRAVEQEVFVQERLTVYWAHCNDFISLIGSSL